MSRVLFISHAGIETEAAIALKARILAALLSCARRSVGMTACSAAFSHGETPARMRRQHQRFNRRADGAMIAAIAVVRDLIVAERRSGTSRPSACEHVVTSKPGDECGQESPCGGRYAA